MKDVRLSLPLTEAMKNVRFTSPLPDTPRLSSPTPRHGRRLLSPKSNPKFVYSLLRSVAGSSSSSPNFLNRSSPRELDLVYVGYLRSHFSASQPKTLRSRARGYLSELHLLTCPEESYSSFCLPFPLLNFLQLSQTSTGLLPLAQTKLPIPC